MTEGNVGNPEILQVEWRWGVTRCARDEPEQKRGRTGHFMEYDDVKQIDHKIGKGRSQSATYLARRGQTGRRAGKLSIFGPRRNGLRLQVDELRAIPLGPSGHWA